MNRFIAVTNDLLTLSVDEDDFQDIYNADVRRAFALFRSTYRALLRKAPVLSLNYRYVTVRPPGEISAGLQGRIQALRNAAMDRFQAAQVNVELLGAAEVWQLILRQPRQVRLLPTGRSTPGRDGYICLVSLSDANAFLRDEGGVPTQNIFEENVRDWQGLTPVNQSIAEELSDGHNRDFWWLNNGITVLCSEYRNDDNLLTVTNPQIVNGLQTCKEIVQYFDKTDENRSDYHVERSVLFKVIRVNDDETRDRIIRATNSQNSVSIAMLRATDPFQRVIEEYLLVRDLYYERRKNYYSNRGRPSAKLISLPFMTQAVLTMFAFRPDDARARPSNPLKREEEYRSLFSSDISLEAYYNAVYICRFVELYLKDHLNLGAKETNNLRFYTALSCAWLMHGSVELRSTEVARLDVDELDDDIVTNAYHLARSSYRALGANDDAAKSSQFKERLLRSARRALRSRDRKQQL